MSIKRPAQKKTKALITGAHGFIGRHLVQALEARDYKVLYVPHIWLTQNIEKLEELPRDIDIIFHLAAYGNMAHQNDEFEILSANITGIWNLLQATRQIPYKAFINVSSSSVTLKHETFYSATKAGGERLCRAFADEHKKPICSVRPYSVYGPGEASFRFIPTIFRSCLINEPMSLVPNPIHDWIRLCISCHRLIDARNIPL